MPYVVVMITSHTCDARKASLLLYQPITYYASRLSHHRMISGRPRSVVPIQSGLVLKKGNYPELRSLDIEHIHDCERFGES